MKRRRCVAGRGGRSIRCAGLKCSFESATEVTEIEMKAWELREFGAQHLHLVERPIPKVNPDEILVQVSAVALNYRDKVVVDGVYLPTLLMPFTPGSDAVGIVVEAGNAVTRFRVGDRVIAHYRRKWLDGDPGPEEITACVGAPLPGVLAEYVVLPESGAVAAPSCLDDLESSTLPIAALTAWFALFEDGQLRPGDWVLVEGTGGVSLFSLQFAGAMGARVVITSRSDDKLQRAKALGASAGVNYRQTADWDKAVLDITGGKGAACVIETAGGTSLQRSINALSAGGRIELIGFLEAVQASINVLSMVRKRAQIRAVAVGHRRAFEKMNCALETLHIKPVIDTVYDFLQLPQAFQHLERGGFGKLVIRLSSTSPGVQAGHGACDCLLPGRCNGTC